MNKKLIIFGVLIVSVVGAIILLSGRKQEPGKLDRFAQCLKDKGAVFYGAYWCPHCQNQKKMVGSSESLLPYVECSTPDGKSQTKVCIDKKIESYPTWEFADGSRLNGEIPLEQLATETGCTLPSGAESKPESPAYAPPREKP